MPRGQVPDWRIHPLFLRFFVFFTGAAVMSVEFSAQRLMEPFFGNSEIVWATLIGIILLALSTGYWVGGRLADRWPTPNGIGLLALGAGLIVGALPIISYPLLTAVSGGLLETPAGTVIASLVGTSALFIIPVAGLGAISPYSVRLLLHSAESAGTKTGSLYFWSTFGSLFGTFAPTLYSIPALGVRTTMWISAVVLIALGVIALARPVLLLLSLTPLVLSLFSSPFLKPVKGLIAEVETPYQFAEVYKLNKAETALSVNDSTGIQSIYTPHKLTHLYYDAYLTLPFMFPKQKPVPTLLIGMAAGTIPTLYAKDVDPYRANVPITGVEIDPELVKLGRKYFNLKKSAAKVISADGRVYVRNSTKKFDLMIVDAYSQEIYIPYYLTTKQFFQESKARLNPGGILAMNVNVTSTKAPLLLAIERTLGTVFRNVYLAKAPGLYNELVVASDRNLQLPRLGSTPQFLNPVVSSLATTFVQVHPGAGLILTDNHAPVQQMTNSMIISQLKAKL